MVTRANARTFQCRPTSGSGENLFKVAVGSAPYSVFDDRHPRKGRPPVGFLLEKVGASLIDGNYIFTGAESCKTFIYCTRFAVLCLKIFSMK